MLILGILYSENILNSYFRFDIELWDNYLYYAFNVVILDYVCLIHLYNYIIQQLKNIPLKSFPGSKQNLIFYDIEVKSPVSHIKTVCYIKRTR